ncbi:ArgR family transcriptional regulator [Pajaroellobacter abortibovis]|uniref:Arginine repressor n=1 Tax=Pajaroellobacter abortibovis TaxID=1882918 RepID=A0A1L6MXZ0_9BACT|nr:ArgR family transcriptional regulator [Pajaroellobacter abortibovis]APS00362.1 ArgR family transcriptional regulator [Pajaroellobacter abortibovis]
MGHNIAIDTHILEIVQNYQVREQRELQKQLKQHGHDVPQATLSRRLKKLKIAKIDGIYQLTEFYLPTIPSILSLQTSESGLIILHTYPGHAHGLAYYIDQKYIISSRQNQSPPPSGILATLAGDDTILIVLRSKAHLSLALEMLRRDFLTPPLKK